ncbi:MAG: hypothetical protein M3126_12690 [Candidatus Eremiobacteraeota bacterium]|nr:hypothetical protein [Candidatus Eremiobacteraeota bacterium]
MKLIKALPIAMLIGSLMAVPAFASEVGVNNTITTTATSGCVHSSQSGYENYNGVRSTFTGSMKGDSSIKNIHNIDVAASSELVKFSGHTQFSSTFTGKQTTTSVSTSSSAFTNFQ